jgi:hypothetical protein
LPELTSIVLGWNAFRFKYGSDSSKAGGNGRERVELEGERSLDVMKAFVEKNRVAVVREEEEL